MSVVIETTGAPPDENGKTLVEFVLTNSGKVDISVPISPNPGDLEPSDAKSSYTVTTLALRVSLSKKPAAIFPGGADLYGSADFPGTLENLAPGQAIRVLTRVALPQARGPNAEPFIASASLDSQTIKSVNGEIVAISQNIGFATSRDYMPDSLLRLR